MWKVRTQFYYIIITKYFAKKNNVLYMASFGHKKSVLSLAANIVCHWS